MNRLLLICYSVLMLLLYFIARSDNNTSETKRYPAGSSFDEIKQQSASSLESDSIHTPLFSNILPFEVKSSK